MELKAYPRKVQDILTVQKIYHIPRYQREYSWEKEELMQIWDDIIDNISIDDYKTNDHFIGSLVLVGQDDSENLEVVDGQQRLTTISIILSALRHSFQSIEEQGLADATYSFIEGINKDGEPFFRVKNPMTYPFFNTRILHKNPDQRQPNNKEEERLLTALKFFIEKLSLKKLIPEINFKKKKTIPNESYKEILKVIRNQVLEFKTIYITVSTQATANTIFETLNAKGKELGVLDLIKNEIFRVVNSKHPSDEAQILWGNIKENLSSRNTADFHTFYRYFWISKYSFIGKDKLYKSFNKEFNEKDSDVLPFLQELEKSSEKYKIINCPTKDDWRETEKKFIYTSLKSLNTFRLISPRIFILRLLEKHIDGNLKLREVKSILTFLEDFHLAFTAITSSSASGLDRKYAKHARDLVQSNNTKEYKKVIGDLKESLKKIKPSKDLFIKGVHRIIYTKKLEKHKPLIQYIIKKIEAHHQNSKEIEFNDFSLEHIRNQEDELQNIGKIGNIIPLSKTTNESLGSSGLNKKLEAYKKSTYKTTQSFAEKNKHNTIWTEDDINKRTTEIGELLYEITYKNL